MGLGYSAGTIFLDVVPSFHGLQRQTERAARDMGRTLSGAIDDEFDSSADRAGRAGEKAGKKYTDAFARNLQNRIGKAVSDIGDVKIDADTTGVMREIAKVRKELANFSTWNIDTDVDGATALAKAKELSERIGALLHDETIDIRVATNLGSARAELEEISRLVRASIGPTKGEYAQAQQEHRAHLETQREAERAATEERRVESRRRIAAERAAADTEKNMAREVAAWRAEQDRIASERMAAIRAKDTADLKQHSQAVERVAATLTAARVAEQEAAMRVGFTGKSSDLTAAIAATKARFEVEGRLAKEAADKRIREAARGLAGEAAAAAMAERATVERYREEARAAAAAGAARMAIARLVKQQEEAAVRNSGLSERQRLLGEATGQAANAFRLFNGYLLAAVTIGPVLIPIIASITAAVGALSVAALAAGAAIGALFFAFAGIGTAVKALSALDKEQRKQATGSSAPKATDTRGLRDAQTALARAREDSGQRIASALRAEQNAQDRLTNALKDQTAAQDDLTDARERAQKQIEDAASDLANNLLDQQQAVLDLQEAEIRLRNTLNDPQATQRERNEAQLAYDKQQQALKDLKTEGERLQKSVDDNNAKGVEGSDLVVEAKERIADADKKVIDSEDDLRAAQAATAQARIEEARAMADAEQRVADAMADLRAKSVAAGVEGSAAMDALREAMLNLSPAGQDFANFLYSLKPLLDQIKAAAETGFLPKLTDAITLIIDKYGDQFVSFIGTIAGVLGDLAITMAQALVSPEWQSFFQTLADMAPGMLTAFGQISEDMASFIRDVLMAFAPYADDFIAGFVGIADAVASWAKNLSGTEGFQTFMDFVKETGPKVWKLLGLIAEVLLKMIEGVLPYIDQLVGGLITVFTWLAEQDPDTLGKVALSILAIVAAIQALAGVLSVVASLGKIFELFGAIGAVLGGGSAAGGAAAALTGGGAAAAGGTAAASGPVGWIILAVAAAVAAVAGLVWWINHLIDTNKEFAKHWNAFWQGVADFFVAIYENWMKPIFSAIATVWGDFILPALDAATAGFRVAWDIISGIFQAFWDVVSRFGDMFYQIFTYIIAPVFRWLYDSTIKPVWENYIKPVFEALGSFIENVIAPAWRRGVDIIKGIWDTIRGIIAAPIRWVIETVINDGIIGSFNWLARKVPGMHEIDPVAIPSSLSAASGTTSSIGGSGGAVTAFAAGGVLPGYTPGRDVHQFYSPTAGRLALSGGEGILVPELVRLLGPSWIYSANAAARRGGSIPGFADGGIIDWFGDAGSWIADKASDALDFGKRAISAPVEALMGLVSDLFSKIPGGDSEIMQSLVAIPRSIATGIGNWILGNNDESSPDTTGRPGMSYRWMEPALRSLLPGARVTSDYRPGAVTATGVQSMHALGRAVDFVVADMMAAFRALKSAYPDSAQLLYSPAGAAQIVWNGRRGDTSGVTKSMHYNHVHWAYQDGGIIPNLYDKGGYIPPGLSMVANKTGKPEPVLTSEQWRALQAARAEADGGGVHIYGDVLGDEEYAERIAAKIESKKRDAAVLAGLTTMGVTG